MPELPEVEVIRSNLEPLLRGRCIRSISVRNPHLREKVDPAALSLMINRSLATPRRRAKYLLLPDRDEQHILLIHFGMSGSLRVLAPEETLHKHDHIVFQLDNGLELRYRDPRRFGRILAYPAAQEPLFLKNLGLEPLSATFDAAACERLARGRHLPIKAFLMDQKMVVGIGNIYANEALFSARIHPAQSVACLSTKQWQTLCDAVKKILKRAIAEGGSSLRDFLHTDGQAGYFQQTLSVYARTAAPCPRCHTPIVSIKQSGRASFFCPNCQVESRTIPSS